jgi:hypothetical protein
VLTLPYDPDSIDPLQWSTDRVGPVVPVPYIGPRGSADNLHRAELTALALRWDH